LGRHDANNTRPILLKLRSTAVQNLIMENLYKLKQARAEYRTVVVAHDMTRKEREECRELVAQAKLKNQQEKGEWVHAVRGPPGQMKIVRWQKTN